MDKSLQTKKKIVGWCLILLIIFTTIELASYGIYRIVILPRAPFLAYQPPDFVDQEAYEVYQDIQDDLLGWPAKSERAISRFTPAFPQLGSECISLYGDSFVYAYDVDDQHAWGNILSETLQCRVENYGVAGYGTDQAYLRFVNNSTDQSPITILGFYPENAQRNVNQYRFLLSGGDLFSFKPRFIFTDEELQLVPTPIVPYDELPMFFKSPAKFLSNESFLPDSEYGPVNFSFPFSFKLARLAGREQMINWLLNKPSWEKFLQPGHPTHSLEITSKIIEEFIDECTNRDKRCLVIIFPSPSSFAWYKENQTLSTKPLVDLLETKGIEVLSLTPLLDEMLEDDPYCEILTKSGQCIGHFNEQGNQMIAEIVAQYLLQEKWLVGE